MAITNILTLCTCHNLHANFSHIQNIKTSTTISHKFPLNGHIEKPTKRYSIHNGKKIIYIMAKTFLNTVPRVVHDCSVETSGWIES